MKVITIGRSSENDIVINDPKVSRVHCQIVQFDNGTFGVVDFGSTNGTFVNGQRVHGQVALKKGDKVQVVKNEVPWLQYFSVAGIKRKNWWLWPMVGGAAAVMLLAVVLVLWLTGIIGAKEILYDGPVPPIATVTLEEDGVSYDVEAAEGQLIVVFDESVSHRKAAKMLKDNNAKIISQIPNVQYYLVEVPVGKEAHFFSRLREAPGVEHIYPNMVDEICAVVPYVMDDFSHSDHGSRVISMMGDRASDFVKIDVGIDKRHVNGNEQALILILANLKDDESAVLNMSFGPSRSKNIFRKQEEIMKSYRKSYIEELKGFIDIAKRFDDKDFVIVKSTGNQGVKNLEDGINELLNLLDSEERAVFERHFILVSAKDDNKYTNMAGDYPNDVSLGKYNKMITKVDISDMTAQDAHWSGTSFSSPRAAGFITTVANSNNMKVTDVLEYVRKATEMAPDHVLTQELLEKVIEGDENSDKTSANEAVIEGVLKMYLLDNMRDGSTTYYLDTEGNVEYASAEEEGSYSQVINRYRNTNENEYIAFVIETDQIIDVRKYLDDNEMELLDESYYSAFMVVPNSYYSGDEFAAKYANKRVRVTGTLYVPGGGWRNATEVVMDLRDIRLFESRENDKKSKTTSDKSVSTTQQGVPAGLVGTRWTTPQIHDNWTGKKRTLEFVNKNQVKVTYETLFYLISTSDEVPAPQVVRYNYYYNSENDKIEVFNKDNYLIMEYKYKNGRLIEPGANSLGDIEYIKL